MRSDCRLVDDPDEPDVVDADDIMECSYRQQRTSLATSATAPRLPNGSPDHDSSRFSVATGAYVVDVHCTRGFVTDSDCGGIHKGYITPYQVPWGTIVPRNIDGLLVPHGLSSTHIAYASERMEPQRMAMGATAGVTAVVAVARGLLEREVPVERVQYFLAKDFRQAFIHFADVPPSHPNFAAIQRASTVDYIPVSRGDKAGTFGPVTDPPRVLLDASPKLDWSAYRFNPDLAATKLDLAMALAMMLDLKSTNFTSSCDAAITAAGVPCSAKNEVAQRIYGARAAGLVTSYSGALTRNQLALAIAKIPTIACIPRGSDNPFGAGTPEHILRVYNLGIMNGATSTSFDLTSVVPRKHLAQVIMNARDVDEQHACS